MKFIETTESAWSAEQLAAAEREIEEQKREWEQNRLAAMREEEERRARELEEEGDIITFSREDATNQVSTKNKKLYRSKKLLNKSRNINKTGRKLVRRTRMAGDPRVGAKGIKNKKLAKRSIVKLEGPSEESVDVETTEECPTLEETQINGETDSLDSSESVASVQTTKQVSNHVDHNSPRTRSRGTVAINLWTLDVSPILPGEKPLRKIKDLSDLTERRKRHKSLVSDDDRSQSDEDKEPNKFHFKRKYVRSKKDSVSSIEDGDTEIKSFNLKNVGEDGRLTEIINKGKVCHVVLSDVIAEGQYSLPEIACTPEESNTSIPEQLMEESSPNENELRNDSSGEQAKEKELNDLQSSGANVTHEGQIEVEPQEPAIVEKETPKENIESNNKLEKTSSHLDNGLDELKKGPGKGNRKNFFKSPEGRRTYRRFGRGGNKTLDNWVKRSPKSGNVNSKKADDNADETGRDVSDVITNESVNDLGQTLPNSDSLSEVGNSSDSKPD